MRHCLGIYREVQNSPGRESDDTLILRAVLEQMSTLGFEAAAMTPEEADRADLTDWSLIVPMCEAYPRLMRLKSLGAGRKAPLIINRPEGVLACYRVEMLKRLAGKAELGFPSSELRGVMGIEPLKEPAFGVKGGVWVKRGDVHNTTTRDVVFCRSMPEVEAVRRDFERREIAHLLLQRHVDGDLVKFYGVGPGRWFTWFYHDPATARRIPFSIDALSALVAKAASETGLEVFGGDAIIAVDGSLRLIDINSWPSFARVREEAARQIAWHLSSRAGGPEKVPPAKAARKAGAPKA